MQKVRPRHRGCVLILKVAPPSRPRKYGRQPKRIRRSAVLAACQKNILDDDWEDA